MHDVGDMYGIADHNPVQEKVVRVVRNEVVVQCRQRNVIGAEYACHRIDLRLNQAQLNTDRRVAAARRLKIDLTFRTLAVGMLRP